MDISNLKFGGEFDLVITHPVTFKPTDIVITLVGGDSKEYRNGQAEQFREAAKSKSGKPEDFDYIPYLRCVKGWKGLEFEGEELEFSFEKAVELFTDDKWLWIYNRIVEAVINRLNFMEKPKKS